jgi:hypothetical protein
VERSAATTRVDPDGEYLKCLGPMGQQSVNPRRRSNNTNRRERAAIGDDEILFRPADDTRECGGCPCSPDCMVSAIRPSS